MNVRTDPSFREASLLKINVNVNSNRLMDRIYVNIITGEIFSLNQLAITPVIYLIIRSFSRRGGDWDVVI